MIRKDTIYYFLLVRLAFLFFDIIFAVPIFILCALSRYFKRPFDVGIGSQPLINSIYHKRALLKFGYSVETFVDSVWHVTKDFDFRSERYFPGILKLVQPYFLLVRSVFMYRCIYIYFTGGPLCNTTLLVYLEPVLLKVANVKVVVMPFGSDVNDLSRTSNLVFVNAMAKDYPRHRFLRHRIGRKIDLWTCFADHIIAGCDWVDYLYYWDTLTLAHFAIDTDEWVPAEDGGPTEPDKPIKLVHAPNHRNLKGTSKLIQAVNELKEEGFSLELDVIEGVPNEEVRNAIAKADVVADQLVIGWYAMFALEGMAMGKPVICYLRSDLKNLYTADGLIEVDELPFVEASLFSVKEVIRDLVIHRENLVAIGKRSRDYVVKHHSLEAIGKTFDQINRGLGISPSMKISP